MREINFDDVLDKNKVIIMLYEDIKWLSTWIGKKIYYLI